MARISGIDLPIGKRIEIALTYIYGIGRAKAHSILTRAKVGFGTKCNFCDASFCRTEICRSRMFSRKTSLHEHSRRSG